MGSAAMTTTYGLAFSAAATGTAIVGNASEMAVATARIRNSLIRRMRLSSPGIQSVVEWSAVDRSSALVTSMTWCASFRACAARGGDRPR